MNKTKPGLNHGAAERAQKALDEADAGMAAAMTDDWENISKAPKRFTKGGPGTVRDVNPDDAEKHLK